MIEFSDILLERTSYYFPHQPNQKYEVKAIYNLPLRKSIHIVKMIGFFGSNSKYGNWYQKLYGSFK